MFRHPPGDERQFGGATTVIRTDDLERRTSTGQTNNRTLALYYGFWWVAIPF